MHFRVKNFGPIEEADMTLKDLNIFIGKNLAGKSYLAYLIWALLSVEPDWTKLKNLYDEYVPDSFIEEVKNEPRKREELASRFKSLVIEVYKRFHEIWGQNLGELLKDTFLVDNLGELIRIGCEKAEVVISNDKGNREIYVQVNKDGLKTVMSEAALKDLEDNLSITIDVGEPFIFMTLRYKSNEDKKSFTKNYQAVGIIPTSFMWVFDGYAPYTPTFVAPDGRCGLIRSIEAYKYVLMAESTGVPINKVDREFARVLEVMYPKTKSEDISAIADFIENKLDIEWILRREQPRYTIKDRGIETPIQRSPSGYRELAPLIYAMRYWLENGSVVFVEEPETHLHPDAQVIITRALAKLSDYCPVIVTTHSITVVDEISNLLRLIQIPSDKKHELGYEEWEGLQPENVGIFLLSSGKVKKIKVYEDGIEESDLDRIVREIANTHARVDEEYEYSRKLQAQK